MFKSKLVKIITPFLLLFDNDIIILCVEMTLNDKEYHIVTARIMFKTDWKQALEWLKARGFDISQATYFRTLAVVDKEATERLFKIAKEFEIIASEEIIKFNNLEKQMYEEYHKEDQPLNRARILQMIANLQPYITALYDQTRLVLEGKLNAEKDNILSKHPE